MTWTDIGCPIVIVPVGSCEQHGAHLPLGSDTMIASHLASALAQRRPDAVVAPAISISASGEHQGFPGTLSIGTDGLVNVIVELVRSAEWAAGVVFVNGHGGNLAAMQRAKTVFENEHRNVLVWWPELPEADLHAGHTETSIMLAISPGLVRTQRAVAQAAPAMSELVQRGVKRFSASGVLGDPTNASAVAGRRIIDRLESSLFDAVQLWAPVNG